MLKALAPTPLITTSVLDFDRDDSELELAATDVEYMAAALLLPDWGLAGLDLQTLSKCPFFWHLLQVASLAGHLWRGCLL